MSNPVTLWMPSRLPFGTRLLAGRHAHDWKVSPKKEPPSQPKIDKRQYYVLYMEGYVE
ncbi:MAG: hypothetical protein AB7F31_06010 [Parachlamydiales bacterium]